MNNIKFYAILMTVLVISMPIAFADSVATITKVKTYGVDNYDGYRRSNNDKNNIEVLVQTGTDKSISANQIQVEGTPFQSCTQESATEFKCVYMDENYGLIEPKSISYNVDLFDDARNLVQTVKETFTVDNIAPVITKMEVIQIGNTIKLLYKIKDEACEDVSCKDKCSGIKKVQIMDKIIDINSESCVYEGSENLDLGDGIHSINLVVYDNVNNVVSRSTDPITVDNTLPKIETNKVFFIKNGKEIETIGVNGLKDVDVQVYIEEEQLKSVTGDLSVLNKINTYKTRYQNLEAECENVGGVFLCKWKKIYLFPSSPNGDLDLIMKDNSDNSGEVSVRYDLDMDSSAPQVQSIQTNCDAEFCYLKEKNNTIKVVIQETGSGFNNKFLVNGKQYYYVALNLGQLSSIYGDVWAQDCVQEGNSWVCTWNNVDVSAQDGNTVKVYVSTLSQDDAGNQFQGLNEVNFKVDKKLPEQKEIVVGSGNSMDYVLQGQSLNVGVLVKDNSPVTATGKFGGVIFESQDMAGLCSEQENNEWLCAWRQIGTIMPGPETDIEFEIVVKDLAGNELLVQDKVDIVEAEGLPKNYWRIEEEAKSIPSAITKESLFREQKVFFDISLTSSAQDIKVVNAIITNCSSNTGFELNPQVLVVEDGVYVQGYTSRGMYDSEEDYSEISADCTLKVVSVVNRKILTQPQNIDVTLKFPIVSSTMGTVDERVTQKINDAKHNLNSGVMGVILKLEKIYDLSKKLCDIVDITTKVQHLMNQFNTIFGAFLQGLKNTPARAQAKITEKKAVKLSEKSNKGLSKFWERSGIKTYCDYMSCDKNLWTSFSSSAKEGDRNFAEGMVDSGMWPQNPKNSLVLSAVMGCIPGIIFNMKKMKQVQCQYIDCLQNEVPEGVPVQFCEEQVSYQECRFVYGQIFELIPFAHLLKQWGNAIKAIFHDPLSLVFAVGAKICGAPPNAVGTSTPDPNLFKESGCKTLWTIVLSSDMAKTFEKIKDGENLLNPDATGDICAEVGLA